MKKVTRACDLCGAVETALTDTMLVSRGWTELQYKFGTTINAYNAIDVHKDICPKCAIKMGMIKENPKNEDYVLRPEMNEHVTEETQVTLEDHLREFIVQIGSEEGWYRE